MSEQKKYQVFLRVVGTVSIEASADSPTEAAEKICDAIHDEREPKFLTLDIEDLETYMPVAYNDENGDTKDIDVPKELVEQEVSNALVGSKLYVLVRIDRDYDGRECRPQAKVFLNEARAHSAMAEEYDIELRRMRGKEHMASERPDGYFRCAFVKDCGGGSLKETTWYVLDADLNGKRG